MLSLPKKLGILIQESMAEREIKSERQKLAADIAEKDKDIEVVSSFIHFLQVKLDIQQRQ